MTPLQQEIMDEIQALSECDLRGLLDFIHFLKSSQDEDAFAVEKIQLAYQQRDQKNKEGNDICGR
ncbi:MAG: hypothetical protein AAF639_11125 [Chloroflexota bacterium]